MRRSKNVPIRTNPTAIASTDRMPSMLERPQMGAACFKLYDRRGYNPEKSASFFATY